MPAWGADQTDLLQPRLEKAGLMTDVMEGHIRGYLETDAVLPEQRGEDLEHLVAVLSPAKRRMPPTWSGKMTPFLTVESPQ